MCVTDVSLVGHRTNRCTRPLHDAAATDTTSFPIFLTFFAAANAFALVSSAAQKAPRLGWPLRMSLRRLATPRRSVDDYAGITHAYEMLVLQQAIGVGGLLAKPPLDLLR